MKDLDFNIEEDSTRKDMQIIKEAVNELESSGGDSGGTDLPHQGYLQYIKSLAVNYTITDDEIFGIYFITTGAGDITITLPTVADNKNRQLIIIKIDSGAGKVIVDGEGAEVLAYRDKTSATIDIELQNSGICIISTSSQWMIIDGIGCEVEVIRQDTTGDEVPDTWFIELVYTKYFTGTSDADSHTDIAHGIADHTKIVHTSICIYNSNTSTYYFLELFCGSSANDYFESRYNATEIEFHHVGSRFQGQLYRIKINYYL